MSLVATLGCPDDADDGPSDTGTDVADAEEDTTSDSTDASDASDATDATDTADTDRADADTDGGSGCRRCEPAQSRRDHQCRGGRRIACRKLLDGCTRWVVVEECGDFYRCSTDDPSGAECALQPVSMSGPTFTVAEEPASDFAPDVQDVSHDGSRTIVSFTYSYDTSSRYVGLAAYGGSGGQKLANRVDSAQEAQLARNTQGVYLFTRVSTLARTYPDIIEVQPSPALGKSWELDDERLYEGGQSLHLWGVGSKLAAYSGTTDGYLALFDPANGTATTITDKVIYSNVDLSAAVAERRNKSGFLVARSANSGKRIELQAYDSNANPGSPSGTISTGKEADAVAGLRETSNGFEVMWLASDSLFVTELNANGKAQSTHQVDLKFDGSPSLRAPEVIGFDGDDWIVEIEFGDSPFAARIGANYRAADKVLIGEDNAAADFFGGKLHMCRGEADEDALVKCDVTEL